MKAGGKMNIQQAKQEIEHTLKAYCRKDTEGRYLYPVVRQRPVVLMGPPGIGKTAIMEQIARECGVCLVAYAMTHHTRQSAIGLPHIEVKVYDGQTFSVTQYTLSEMVAEIYEQMERTGLHEGILFLDEINCVSQTLAPTMLQLLQSKTFGSHRVPEGWMIVAAGNPPQYNSAAREFDIATLDRVRMITVEPDLNVWIQYAWRRQIHGAIISYLRIREDRFYKVEQKHDESTFVTARGWEDMSELLKSYETLGLPVSQQLAAQFLKDEQTALEFGAYYQLYRKYGTDYAIADIMEGTQAHPEAKIAMAKNASFEERFTVVNLTLEYLNTQFCKYVREDRRVALLHQTLETLRSFWKDRQDADSLRDFLQLQRNALVVKRSVGLIGTDEEKDRRWVLSRLEKYHLTLQSEHITDTKYAFSHIRSLFACDVEHRAQTLAGMQSRLARAFSFLEQCFGEGQEMLLFVSGLTRSEEAMAFISLHGCDEYLRRSGLMLYREQEKRLQEACQALEL